MHPMPTQAENPISLKIIEGSFQLQYCAVKLMATFQIRNKEDIQLIQAHK